jgi:RNA polymerase sporulation-specific sigma factor
LRLQDYLLEVSKIRLLEPAEERRLWVGYKQQGDMDNRRCLIEHYQPLVVKALARWQADDRVLMDLVQEGIVGLIEAVESFDIGRSVAFSLYAIHRIRGRMLNYLEKEAKTAQVSMDAPWRTEDGSTFANSLPDSAPLVAETAEQNFLLDQLRTALNRLPHKERLALNGVYIEEQEPRHVAQALQVSPSHLSRLQKQGIRRVRGMLSRLMCEMKK